ncbi:Oidioi.mRNA.OKI2018_I69.chr1.g3468.t1.cds [Oikopleura dioica]|uniref:Oidioi.mRNA.OKI2018_I69.chr1.g3468.t1.cds n=1 Tax=Oikopleura dioica TaxID=34765 RepID=A0ABN7SU84_OIKDI|nr:Oidioi.mRNA.OKI2018_I69.chr1.g3468.t1.cds [Oikopleura dioica]
MSLNTFNPEPGMRENKFTLAPNERVMRKDKNVVLEFKNQSHACREMKGKHTGNIHVTNLRVFFLNESAKSKLRDFIIPFNCLSKLELKQPIFGSNYVIADVKAAPGGGWEGTTQINLTFNSGGCIEFGKFVLATANSSRTQTVYTQPQFGLQGYPAPPPNPYTQNQQGQFNAATGMYEFQSNSEFNYGAPMAPPVAGQRLPDAPPRYEDLPQSDLPPHIASSVPEKKND